MNMNTDTNTEHLSEEDERDDTIRAKILHVLSIYPIISPTMLQSGIGPQVKPMHWRPVLEGLIAAGQVHREEKTLLTPADRANTYTLLMLEETHKTCGEVADAMAAADA